MATGVGEVQGSQLDIGASGAYRYVNIYQVDFDESSGKSTVYYTYGTYVNYGNFWSSIFTSEGSCYHQYTVDGVGIYDRHWGDASCEYNGSLSFWEKCYFNSYSYGYVESVVSFKWYPTLPKYTITYNANGGSGAPAAISRTWSKTNQALSSSAPTRTGYTFKGWATTSGGSVAYSKGGSIPWASANKTQTLYAVWQENTWTVSYNGNGATSGSTASQTKYYTQNLTLRSNGFTRTGFTFKRWNVKSDDSGTNYYAAGGTYTTNAAATLYAIWERTVSYDLNGASGTAPSPQTSIATSDITLAAAPARNSYEFKQWNTVADDSGTAYGAGASYPANAATTTLYAIWNPVITYKPNGASGSDHEQVKTYGTTATLKASDTYSRTGFAFKEWNTNQSGTGTPYAAGASYTSNAATTLYAIWNATLSYDANEGIGAPGSQTAKATEEITISETVPTRPGYTFLGWGTSAGASAASYQPGDAYAASGGSIVLYAVWRCDIRLADVTCSLVDANGNDDPLGRYVKASVSYDATTSGHGLSRIAMTLNHSGVDDYLEKTSSLGLEGTETFTFGPYAYDLFDPHGGYHIGRIDAENADGTISASVDLDATSYKNPVIRALSTFRTENVGGVYEASDDGTSLGIEVSYTVSSSRTQSAPRSIAVTVKNSSGTVVATRTFSNISGASGVARLDVYHDSSFPSDILVNGELISAEDSYGVTVVVSDAYSDVVTDAKARSTDTVTIAYFTMDFLGDAHLYNPTEDTQVEIGKVYYTRSGSGTFESPYVYTAVANPVAADLTAYYEANGAQPGHGIGIGKPSTREGLDVGMEAFFDQDVHGSGEVSATDSGNVVHNLTEKANTSDLGDLAFKDTASASDIPAINGITDFSTYVYSAQESRAANTVLAAPNGSAGTASFRALVAADIPDLSGTYVKRQPASATDLPQDTSTSSGYPLVLSDSFANSGVVSYMTAANFRTLINAPSLSESNQYQNCTQFVKFTGVDSSKSNNDISSNISRGWEMLDKNDKYISYLETTANTDGSIQLSLVARNLGTGSNVNNGLYIKVANDGTRSVSVSEAAPWRSGLAVCGVKTVSKTTSSFTSYHTTTTITAPASGWTCIGFVRCCSNGDVDTPYVDSWSQSGTTVTASIWRATTASITVTLTALFVNQSL